MRKKVRVYTEDGNIYFSSSEKIVKFDYVYSVLYGLGVVTSDNSANYRGETPLLVEYLNNLNTYIPCNTDGTYCNDGKNIYENDCRKVVATSDSKLETIEEKAGDNQWVRSLPTIPQSFVESYAKNPVEYVELEYDTLCKKIGVECSYTLNSNCHHQCDEFKLKLTPNNEVIVHFVEEQMYTGVSWDKGTSKWRAGLKVNGKTKYIGLYTDELVASNAYQKEIEKLNELKL